jgi:ferrous iron transport protein B
MVHKNITIALAGNANVGKSVIFNHLTGLHQHIGNWPGKTVERAEGTLVFEDYMIDVIDLPGIYSLSTYSLEELVSREYIASEKPDVIINVIDASVLERNLFFTLQLLELETPMVVALNQIDIATRKGVNIDQRRLAELLGVPVISCVATKGIGLDDLVRKAIEIHEMKNPRFLVHPRFGLEIEERIGKLTAEIEQIKTKYPPRWIAIKLLEGDPEVERLVYTRQPSIENKAEALAEEIKQIHSEPCSSVIASERYNVANQMARESLTLATPPKPSWGERLASLTVSRTFGYPIMILVMASLFYGIFSFGNFASALLSRVFEDARLSYFATFGSTVSTEFVWKGLIEGLVAGITIALPYIAPFYVAFSILESSGYLPRVAFLMDSVMHKIGLHGKAFIPIMLGYGCCVPGCIACRIMETQRERFLASFLTTLVPCAARTVVILGLVGAYVGIRWALLLYAFDLLLLLILGRIAFKVLPGEPVGLIMEMPSYKMPSLNVIAKQTWFRLEEFVRLAFPLIVVGNLVLNILQFLDVLPILDSTFAFITVDWLGLPAVTATPLIFGIFRKELTLIMLAALVGTSNFATILTPTQMIVYATVTMLYIPCVATIAVLIREFGYRKALATAVFEVGFAILIGGLMLRILELFPGAI